MGGSHGIDRSTPPGGVLLFVQDTGCMVQPRFSAPKPQAPAIDENLWRSFDSKVAGAASSMYSERSQYMAFLVIFIIVLPKSALGLDEMFTVAIDAALAIVVLSVIFGWRYFIVKQNEAQDEVIRSACAGLASATDLSVTYRTQWTGFCKPRGAQPFRAVAIAPGGAALGAASPATLGVVVPAGAGPGTSLQVQTPQGQPMQVIVPEGVTAGQTFQVQVPQVVVVQATVVEPP